MRRSKGLLLLLFLLAGRSFGQQEPSSDLTSLLAAAQQAQAANNFLGAAADYKRAVKLRPDLPELRANLGLMQHEAADYPEAIRSFQETLRLKPSLYVPNLFLGIDYLRTGRAKEAIPLLLRAEKMNPNDPLPSLTLGHAYAVLGEPIPAAHELRRATELGPKQTNAWFDLGMAQLDIVEQDARTMTGAHPDTSYAKALFAEALVKQLRYKEAIVLYKEVIAAPEQPPCMRSEAGFAYLKAGDAQEADLQFGAERSQHPECTLALLGQARLRIDSEADEAALQLIGEAWTRDHAFFAVTAPVLFDAAHRDRLGSFLSFFAGQHAKGTVDEDLYEALTEPAQVEPGREEGDHADKSAALPSAGAGARGEGRKEYMAGHYGRCTELLRASLHGGDIPVLETLAACSFFSGDYSLTSEASSALRSVPGRAQLQALYWSISANEKLAFDSLSRFEQLEPDSTRSHVLLGDMYRQRQRYDDAQKEYAKALDHSPEDPAALLGLATAFYGDANIEKTVEFVQKALVLKPDDPEVNLLMGEALVAQHMYPAAEPFLLKGLGAKPQVLPHVHALLGEAYGAQGKTQDAIRELQLGAGSDRDGSVHYQLARQYTKIGDSSKAALAIQEMKALQAKRREGATVIVQDPHSSDLSDTP